MQKFGFFQFQWLILDVYNWFQTLDHFFLSKKIHFIDKIEKKSKLGDFLEIRKISCIWSLLVMTFFSFVLKLMSYGRLILRRVKLTNFENVYHRPVVLWRLYLLSKFTSILEFLQHFKTLFLSPLIFDGVPFNINDKL